MSNGIVTLAIITLVAMVLIQTRFYYVLWNILLGAIIFIIRILPLIIIVLVVYTAIHFIVKYW